MPQVRTKKPRRDRGTAPAGATATVEESIVLTLFDLANQLVRRGDRLAAVAGLTTQQWLVLLQVAGDPNFPSTGPKGAGPLLASDIARARGVTRATVSVVISALRRRGLVTERADPSDARRRFLALTPEGAAVLAAIQPVREAANRRLLARLGHRDRAQFLRCLVACLDELWDLHEAEQGAVARVRLTRGGRSPGVKAR